MHMNKYFFLKGEDKKMTTTVCVQKNAILSILDLY